VVSLTRCAFMRDQMTRQSIDDCSGSNNNATVACEMRRDAVSVKCICKLMQSN